MAVKSKKQETPFRSAMRLRDLTGDELAKIVGCSRMYVNLLTRGKRNPSNEMRRKFAKALRIDSAILWREMPDGQSNSKR